MVHMKKGANEGCQYLFGESETVLEKHQVENEITTL